MNGTNPTPAPGGQSGASPGPTGPNSTGDNILLAIKTIIAAVTGGVNTGAAYTAPYVEDNLKGIRWLLFLGTLIPLPLAVPGIAFGISWLTATAGLMWGIALLILGVWGGPIGVLIAALWKKAATLPAAPGATIPAAPAQGTGFFVSRWFHWWADLPAEVFRGIKNGAERYIKFMRGVILAELIVALIFCLVPVRNNPRALPLALLAGVVIWFAIVHWEFGGGWFKKFIYRAAIATVVILVVSFFIPSVPKILGAAVTTTSKSAESFADKVKTNGWSAFGGGGTATVKPNAIYTAPDEGSSIDLPDEDVILVEVHQNSSQWTGWMRLSPFWGYGARLDWGTNALWLQFLGDEDKGKVMYFPPHADKAIPTGSSSFRVKTDSPVLIVSKKRPR